jgi:hypothetical protein
MKRVSVVFAVALPLLALTAAPAFSEVKTREKTTVKIEALPGWLMRMMGAKKEGLLSSTAVKGSRKVTVTENTGQIVDLSEEKVYDVDFRKKEYRVTTFEELRRRMKEAQERAAQQAQREEKGEEQAEKPQKEYEIDFDAKDTGQTRQIAGHDARQVIMIVTVREKGRTLEEGGGLVMTTASWLGPKIEAMKEVADFDLRYFKQVYGADAALSAEQMGAILAMFPLVAKAQERMRQENVNLEGTPLSTTVTFEAVKSAEQLAQESQQQQSGGGGGIGGMLARSMTKKKEPSKPRATIFTTEIEVQEISTTVQASDLEIPAGFKEKK